MTSSIPYSLQTDLDRGDRAIDVDNPRCSESSLTATVEPEGIQDSINPVLLDVSKGLCLQTELRRLEQELIEQALILTQGHQRLAAQLLGVKPTTLNSKIKKLSLLEKLRRRPRS